jgi:hypothetical protein
MNRLLAIGGFAVLVVGLALLVLPVSSIPLLDANRQVLVESAAGGQCAGEVYATTQGNGSEADMAECMATTSQDTTTNWQAVQPAFCRGIIAKGLAITQGDCESVMAERQMWATATGTVTASWNRRFPYPGDVISSARPITGGESRTGDREGNDREGNIRGD